MPLAPRSFESLYTTGAENHKTTAVFVLAAGGRF
jgi:hypothetical protein